MIYDITSLIEERRVTTFNSFASRDGLSVGKWDAASTQCDFGSNALVDAAYELGVEHGQFTLAGEPVTGDCRVTNIYRRESGAWKIVHHHTDTAQSMIDVLSRLKKKT